MCVGLRYTEILVEPSWLILTQVSRKGILPSFSCSEVNWICWSMEFRCSEKELMAFSFTSSKL